MRIIIKLAVILALLAALVYGGLRGYVWYQVKTSVDEATQQMAPFAEVSYKSIYTSPELTGTVGVDGIVIKPKMFSDEIKIQSVRVAFPDIFALLRAGGDVQKRELPEQMKLSISGLAVDLNGQLLAAVNEMQKQAQTTEGPQSGFPLENMDALGCGDIKAIGIDALTRMGYQTLDLDTELAYQYERLRDDLRLSLVVRSKGMYTLDMKAQLKMDPNKLVRSRGTLPTINSVKVDYIDAGYAVLRNRFCAAQLESTEEMFIGRHLEALSRAVGATFPLDTVEAYKKFLAGGSRLSVTIAPPPGTDLTTLGSYQTQDAIELLGMGVAIDTHEVDFKRFEWGKSYTLPTEATADGGKKGAAPALPMATVQMPAVFRATPPARLGRYVGSQVKIETRSGLRREGVIESADGDSVTVRLLAPGGKGFISFPIPLQDITSAKVLY